MSLPALFLKPALAIDPILHSLTAKYKEKAALLRQTGGGIDPANSQSTQGLDNEISESYYIPAAGPQDDTPQEAKNLWGQCLSK